MRVCVAISRSFIHHIHFTEMIEYPIKGQCKTVQQKVEILAQIRFGRISEKNMSFNMTQEVKKVMENGRRVTSCVKKYLENVMLTQNTAACSYRRCVSVCICMYMCIYTTVK